MERRKILVGKGGHRRGMGGGVNDQNFSIYKVVKEYLFIFKGGG